MELLQVILVRFEAEDLDQPVIALVHESREPHYLRLLLHFLMLIDLDLLDHRPLDRRLQFSSHQVFELREAIFRLMNQLQVVDNPLTVLLQLRVELVIDSLLNLLYRVFVCLL